MAKYELLIKQEGKCYYCKVNLLKLSDNSITIDHVIPRINGGVLSNNSVLACKTCNRLKAFFSETDFMKWMRKHRKAIKEYNLMFWKK